MARPTNGVFSWCRSQTRLLELGFVRWKEFWYYYLSSCLTLRYFTSIFLCFQLCTSGISPRLLFSSPASLTACSNFAYAPFQFCQDFPFKTFRPRLKSTKQHVPHPSASHSLNHLISACPYICQQKKVELTSHKTASVTNQERGGPSILLGPAQPPKHILLRPLLSPLRKFLK
jgi:hypothetical protein